MRMRKYRIIFEINDECITTMELKPKLAYITIMQLKEKKRKKRCNYRIFHAGIPDKEITEEKFMEEYEFFIKSKHI